MSYQRGGEVVKPMNDDTKKNEKSTKETKKKMKTSTKWTILGIIGLVCGVVFYFGQQILSNVDEVYEPVEVDSIRNKELKITNQEPFSILLLGIDNGDKGRSLEDGGRSDTMILATVNPKEKTTTLVSIPRDSYAEIVGYGMKDKVNHAYAFGGAEMAVATVQQLMQVPIDYYAEVNFKGIEDLVDAIEGIEVVPNLTFTYDNHSFTEGVSQKMDGQTALAYARMRYDDPEGDYGRQERQRQIIEASINKALTFDSIMRFKPILEALGDNVRTNMSFSDMVEIQAGYRDGITNFESHTLKGRDLVVNGVYYMYIEPETILEMTNKLRVSLELDEISLSALLGEDTNPPAAENDTTTEQPKQTETNQSQPGGEWTRPNQNNGGSGNSSPPASQSDSGGSNSGNNGNTGNNGGNGNNSNNGNTDDTNTGSDNGYDSNPDDSGGSNGSSNPGDTDNPDDTGNQDGGGSDGSGGSEEPGDNDNPDEQEPPEEPEQPVEPEEPAEPENPSDKPNSEDKPVDKPVDEPKDDPENDATSGN